VSAPLSFLAAATGLAGLAGGAAVTHPVPLVVGLLVLAAAVVLWGRRSRRRRRLTLLRAPDFTEPSPVAERVTETRKERREREARARARNDRVAGETARHGITRRRVEQ
jgi:hypothetical protein